LALPTILMGAVQFALIPAYRRVWFNPGFWSFAFTYATACTLALRWTEPSSLQARPSGNGSH
jgi:tellurite resistance protein